MNVLRDLYSDGCYEAYLNTKPTLAVAVIGGDAMLFEQALLQQEAGILPVCVTSLSSVDAIAPRKTKTATRADYFLKSGWCLKHQRQSFSCIVLPISWDRWEGKREQEKNVVPFLERAKGKVRSLRCKVIVACTTSRPITPSRLAAFQEATHTIKIFLGSQFAGAVLMTENGNDRKPSTELLSAVMTSSVEYHTQEIERLRIKRRDLALENKESGAEVVNAAVARTYFQIGWHQLVLSKHVDAVQTFFKACRVCRSIHPRFPPFEARLAVTVFLRQIVDALPACGELFTYGSPSHSQVTRMLDWMKGAYPAVDVSSRGKKMLRVLQLFLEAEWSEFMARRTENIDPHIRNDLLFSAASALNDTLAFLPTEEEKLQIPPPQFLGSEYRSDVHTGVMLSGSSRQTIETKMRALVEESSAAIGRMDKFDKPLFKALVLDVHREATVSTAFLRGRLTELLQQWPAALTILNNYLYQAALRVFDETELLEEIPTEQICQLLVSGCVDPLHPATQPIFLSVLEKLTLRTPALVYPQACFLPLVSAVFSVETTECVAVSDSVTLNVSLFTTSVANISVSNIQVEMSPTNAGETEFAEIVVARAAESGSLIVSSTSKLSSQCSTQKIALSFPKPGKFMCTKLSCDARIGAVTVPTIFQMGKTNLADNSAALLVGKRNEIITVRMPPALLTVEGPTMVEAVEGETVMVNFAICSTVGNLINGKLIAADTSSFLDLDSVAAVTISGGEQVTSVNARARQHVLPNVDAGVPTLFSISGQCVRSGYFTIPLQFQYESHEGVPVEVTKIVRIVIDPPFDVHFECANSVTWSMEGGTGSKLFLPSTSTVHVRKDLNVLEDASDVPLNSEGFGAKFFYCVRYDSDGVSSSAPIPLEDHSVMTVVTRVICRVKNGLTVTKADFVSHDQVELQYVSYGLLPCTLEMGESVTIVAQLRVKETMTIFLPGFLRILFSPRGKTGSRLFADLGLPTMTVVSLPVCVTTVYPPFVACNQPFVFGIKVQNTAASPFQGELIVDTRTSLFTLGGRAQWSFLLGPHEAKSTELLLTPSANGACVLPHFQIRNTANGSIVATNHETRMVTVI